MPKKADVAPDNEITDKSKMELEALNPRQKKSKPIVDKLEKKENPKDKKEKSVITQKDIVAIKKLVKKIGEII